MYKITHEKKNQENKTNEHQELYWERDSRAKKRRKIRNTLSSQSRLNDFGSVCLCAETIKIGTITISKDDDDDTKKHTSFFDGSILCWYYIHTHTRTRKTYKNGAPTQFKNLLLFVCFALFHFALWFMFRLLALFSFSPPSTSTLPSPAF